MSGNGTPFCSDFGIVWISDFWISAFHCIKQSKKVICVIKQKISRDFSDIQMKLLKSPLKIHFNLFSYVSCFVIFSQKTFMKFWETAKLQFMSSSEPFCSIKSTSVASKSCFFDSSLLDDFKLGKKVFNWITWRMDMGSEYKNDWPFGDHKRGF